MIFLDNESNTLLYIDGKMQHSDLTNIE